MWYNINESKFSLAAKHFFLWFSLLFLGIIAIFLFKKNDVKVPQRTVVVNLNLKDQINICIPDEKKIDTAENQ